MAGGNDEIRTIKDLIRERERRNAIQGIPCVSATECGSGFGCLGGYCRELAENGQSGAPTGCGDPTAVDPQEYDISIFDPRVPDTWPDPTDAAGCCPGFDINKKSTWPYDPADPTTWPGWNDNQQFVDPAESAGGCSPPDGAVGLPAPPWGDFGYQLAGGCGEPGCGSLQAYGDDFTRRWTDPAAADGFDPYDPATWPKDELGFDSQNPATWPEEWRNNIPNAQNEFVPGLTQIDTCGNYICDHLGCRPGLSPGRDSANFTGTVCCDNSGCWEGECGKGGSANILEFQVQCNDGECAAVKAGTDDLGNIDSFLESNYDLTKNEGWVNALFSVEPASRYQVTDLGDIVYIGTGDLDFEARETDSVTVTALTQLGEVSRTFTLNILNSNSYPVVFDAVSTPGEIEIPENTSPGAVLWTFQATDEDRYTDITYSLPRDAHGRFAIDEQKGELTLVRQIDAEVAQSWSLSILATSSDGSQAMHDLTVKIIDIPDNDLIYLDTNYAANFCRVNSNPGTDCGIRMEAFDLDISVQDQVTFSLVDDAGGRFGISDNGVVFVKAAFNETIKGNYPDNPEIELVETLEAIPGAGVSIQIVSEDGSSVIVFKQIPILGLEDPEPAPEVELADCLANAYRDPETLDCNCRPGYTYYDCDPNDPFDCVLQEDIPEVVDPETGEVIEEMVPAGTRIPAPGCFRNEDAIDQPRPVVRLLPDTSDSPGQTLYNQGDSPQSNGIKLVSINPAWPSILEDSSQFSYTGLTVRAKLAEPEGEQDWCCASDGCYTGTCSEADSEPLCCNPEGSCWAGPCSDSNRPQTFCVTRTGVVEGTCEQAKKDDEDFTGLDQYNSVIRILPDGYGNLKFENQPTFGPHGGPKYQGYACSYNRCNRSSAGRINGYCCDEYGCTAGGCGTAGRVEPVVFVSDGIEPGIAGDGEIQPSVNTYYPWKLYCGYQKSPEGDVSTSFDCFRGFANTGEPTYHRERTSSSDDDTQVMCWGNKSCEEYDVYDETFREEFNFQQFRNDLTTYQNSSMPLACDEGGCEANWTAAFGDFIEEIRPKDGEGSNVDDWQLPQPNTAEITGWFLNGGFRVRKSKPATNLYDPEEMYDICCDKDGCKAGPCRAGSGTVELCCDEDTGNCTKGPCGKFECTDFCQSQYEEDGQVDEECYYGTEKLYCESQCQTCDGGFNRCYDLYMPDQPVDAEGQPPCACIPEKDFPDCWKCDSDGKARVDCGGCQICEEIEDFDCGCGGPRVNFTSCVPACVPDANNNGTNEDEVEQIKVDNAIKACIGQCAEWSEELGVPTIFPLSVPRNPQCDERPGCSTKKYYPGTAATGQSFSVSDSLWGIGRPDGATEADHGGNELYYNGVLDFNQNNIYQVEIKGQAAEGSATGLLTIYIDNRNTNEPDWRFTNITTEEGNPWNREAYDAGAKPVANSNVEIDNDSDTVPYYLGTTLYADDADFGTIVTPSIVNGNPNSILSLDITNDEPTEGDELEARIMVNGFLDEKEWLLVRTEIKITSSDEGERNAYLEFPVKQPEDKIVNLINLEGSAPTIARNINSLYTGLKVWATTNYYFSYPDRFSITSSDINGFTINSDGEVYWNGNSQTLVPNTIVSIDVTVDLNDNTTHTGTFNFVVIESDSDNPYEAPEPTDNAQPPTPQYAQWNDEYTDWWCLGSGPEDDPSNPTHELVDYKGRSICLPLDEEISPCILQGLQGNAVQPTGRPIVPLLNTESTGGCTIEPVGEISVAYVPESTVLYDAPPNCLPQSPPYPEGRQFTGFFVTMEISGQGGTVNLDGLPECPPPYKCKIISTGEDNLGAFALRQECPRDNEPEDCECGIQCNCHQDCPSCTICEDGECVPPKELSGYCCPCEEASAFMDFEFRRERTPETTCDGEQIRPAIDEIIYWSASGQPLPSGDTNGEDYLRISIGPGVEPVSIVERFSDALLVKSCDSFGGEGDLAQVPVVRLFYQTCLQEESGSSGDITTPPETQVENSYLFPEGFLRSETNYAEVITAKLKDYENAGDPQQPEISCSS